jgi:hypothetical protein
MTEEWRPVPDYEGFYEVSNLGRLRSLTRTVRRSQNTMRTLPGRLLAPKISNHGYRLATLSREATERTVTLHSLVAAAFIGPRPDGQHVRHLDGDKLNNRASNLAYGTALENAADTRRHGAHSNTKRTHCARGHDLNDPNNHIPSYTTRRCRACHNERSRRYRRTAA